MPPLRCPAPLWTRLLAHLEAAYPREGCGILFGRRSPEATLLLDLTCTPNADPAPAPERRFSIPPEDLCDAQRHARAHGFEILGFFHSHPDRPPLPSPTDLALAWPGTSCLIVALRPGQPPEARSYLLPAATSEPLEFLSPNPPSGI